MGIWNWLWGQRPAASVGDIAQRATSLVIESIRPVVEKRIYSMGIHEARGYVRARAGHLVRQAVEIVMAHDPPQSRPESNVVFSAALEELLRTLYRRPSQTQFKVRRAA